MMPWCRADLTATLLSVSGRLALPDLPRGILTPGLKGKETGTPNCTKFWPLEKGTTERDAATLL